MFYRKLAATCSSGKEKRISNNSDLLWIEVADPLAGQVAFASNFGAIVEEEVGTPGMTHSVYNNFS